MTLIFKFCFIKRGLESPNENIYLGNAGNVMGKSGLSVWSS